MRPAISHHAMRWAAMLIGVTGCAGPHVPEGPASPEPLRVAAASDLQLALPDLGSRYQILHPGQKIDLVFGSTGNLARQIRQGAPFDVFLAADRRFIDELASDGLIESDSIAAYAEGELAVVVPADSKLHLDRVDELTNPEVRNLAIASPDLAPYGRAAREALQNAGVWESLQTRIVTAETVAQAGQFVETGNADVGLVSRSIAASPRLRSLPVRFSSYAPIVQTMGVVRGRPDPARARAFTAFLLGSEGQSVLTRHGFRPPPRP